MIINMSMFTSNASSDEEDEGTLYDEEVSDDGEACQATSVCIILRLEDSRIDDPEQHDYRINEAQWYLLRRSPSEQRLCDAAVSACILSADVPPTTPGL